MQTAARLIDDADSHIMEPLDWLFDFADPAIRVLLPRIDVRGHDERVRKIVDEVRSRIGTPERRSKLESDVLGGLKGWAALGGFDPGERSLAMDRLGYAHQLVFSTFAGTQFLWTGDMALLYGGARAHNRGMAQFCAGDRRLMGVGMLPLEDIERALAEIRMAAKEGIKAFWIPIRAPHRRSPGHVSLDPVWQAIAQSGLPFMLHVGTDRPRAIADYRDHGQRQLAEQFGGEHFGAKDMASVSHSAEMFLSSLIFDGVFERVPNLRCGIIELGASWLANFLERIDTAYDTFVKRDPVLSTLRRRPSDYVLSNVWVTPFPLEDLPAIFRRPGSGNLLYSTDFPHPEGGTDPEGIFTAALDEIGASAAFRQDLFSGNFRKMMGLA